MKITLQRYQGWQAQEKIKNMSEVRSAEVRSIEVRSIEVRSAEVRSIEVKQREINYFCEILPALSIPVAKFHVKLRSLCEMVGC
ncbi:MAG: hypothetical protein HC903_03455 [Methylacidiphilales bacterium]|nr:hypothetical protein [Candidatus Methylacidiphilales bacterium]NJR18351.1 hypothetical protein [Calothrix sp. CSU_2_0]